MDVVEELVGTFDTNKSLYSKTEISEIKFKT